MPLTKTDLALSAAGLAPRIALICIFLRRHLPRLWPLFFLYCCYSILVEIALIMSAFFFTGNTYFLINFGFQLIYVLLGLLAMNESFQRTFSIYHAGHRWFRFLFPAVVLVVMSISAARWFHNVSSTGEITDEIKWAAFLTFQLGGEYSRAAVFGIFGLLVFFWQPPWQPRAFAIMKGFGFFTIVGMLANLLRSDFGTKMNHFFSYAPPVAYIVACFIWLGGFLAPEPEKPAPRPGLVNVAELRELVERLTRAIR
jgi:hypothetical protein